MADGGGAPRGGLRPIKPQRNLARTPATLPEWLPDFEWVSPLDLRVDEAYQRPLGQRSLLLIGRIVGGWDWRRFKPPIVAEIEDGVFEVIDGQHTAIAAASHGGIDEIPVMIVEAVDLRERADAFLGHNTHRLPLTCYALFHAALTAREPSAVDIAAAAEAAAIGLPEKQKNPWDVNDCIAFGALAAILKRRGQAGLTSVLRTCAVARQKPLRSWLLQAVDELLFGEPYRVPVDKARAVVADLAASLGRKAGVFGAEHRLTTSKAAAVLLFRESQRGRRRIA